MASRGGGHRRKVENVDLIDVLEDHVRSHGLSRALQFGIYENIDRTQAAFAAGLAYNKDLLMKAATQIYTLHCISPKNILPILSLHTFCMQVLRKQPAGELKPAAVANDMVHIAKMFPGLNKSGMSPRLWAGRRVDILCTMLNHLRRVKTDQIRQATLLTHSSLASDIR